MTARTTIPRDAVLLIVDVQQGMDRYAEQYHRNNPDLEANIGRLQRAWRETGRPIIHVQHLSKEPDSPLRPGQAGVEFKDEVRHDLCRVRCDRDIRQHGARWQAVRVHVAA